MLPSRNPITASRRMASSSSCSVSIASSELACSIRSPMSRMAVAGSLAFSGATLVGLVWTAEDRPDHAERGGAEIHHVAVTVHERLGVVVDVVGRALMGDDEGVLVGCCRLDFGSKTVVARELGFVFVDHAREVSRRARRHLRSGD
jgi:hypothetical protein